MKVLITGASGRIGKKVCASLAANHELVRVDKNTSDTDCIFLDIENRPEVDAFLRARPGIQAVIHLAAKADGKGGPRDAAEFVRANVDATSYLAAACAENLPGLTRFIFASSVTVYGESQCGSFTEDSVPAPSSPYASSKSSAEEAVKAILPDSCIVLRFAPVYGPGNLGNLERRVLLGGRPFLVGTGSARMSLLNVDNLVEVIARALGDPSGLPVGIYNVSDPGVYSFRDILESLGYRYADALRLPRFLFRAISVLGRLLGRQDAVENASKLLDDHLYPSDRIRSVLSLAGMACLQSIEIVKSDID